MISIISAFDLHAGLFRRIDISIHLRMGVRIRNHPDFQWSNLIEMHIALREGNGDVGFAEFMIDRPVQFMQHGYPIINASDKHPQFKIETVVAKAEKYGLGLRLVDNQRIGFGRLEHQFFRQVGIGAIGNTDGNAEADNIVGQ